MACVETKVYPKYGGAYYPTWGSDAQTKKKEKVYFLSSWAVSQKLGKVRFMQESFVFTSTTLDWLVAACSTKYRWCLHNSWFTLHSSYFTLQIPKFIHHTSQFVLHTLHVIVHTSVHNSQFTLHSSYFTLHSSCFTVHASQFIVHI